MHCEDEQMSGMVLAHEGWLGDLPGWANVALAVLGLGGGGAFGGFKFAQHRQRYEDRLWLFDLLHSVSTYPVPNWDLPMQLDFAHRAIRLPYTDRCIAWMAWEGSIDGMKSAFPDAKGTHSRWALDILEYEIAPRRLGLLGQWYRKARIWWSSPSGVRMMFVEEHSSLRVQRALAPYWPNRPMEDRGDAG